MIRGSASRLGGQVRARCSTSRDTALANQTCTRLHANTHTLFPGTRSDLAAQGGECFRYLSARGCDSKQYSHNVDCNGYPHTDAYKSRL
jgi:hypothetical protein